MKDWINTIQLGDCYELIKQIPDKSIDLVYIDIPYEKTKSNGYYSGGGSFGVNNRKYQRDLRDEVKLIKKEMSEQKNSGS